MSAEAEPLVINETGTEAVVQVRGLVKVVGRSRVLDHIDLTVAKGEVLLVSGESGSGKSTLLRILEGIEQPTSGQALLLGQPLWKLTARQRSTMIRSVGIGFQDPLLDNALSVLENLLALARANGRFDESNVAEIARLATIADTLKFGQRLGDQTAVLSGGEKLRLALGRALACRPTVLLLDEPTHMIDSAGKSEIFTDLAAIIRQEGLTVVLSSHDDAAHLVATREIVLDRGRVVHEHRFSVRPRAGSRSRHTS